MKKAVGVIALVSMIAIGLLLSTTSFDFLISDTFSTHEDVNERSDLFVFDTGDYNQEYYTKWNVVDVEEDEVVDTSGAEIYDEPDERVIGESDHITLDTNTARLDTDLGQFFDQFQPDYKNLLVPEEYEHAVKDVEMNFEVGTPPNNDRTVELSYRYEHGHKTDGDIPEFLDEYRVDLLFDIDGEGDTYEYELIVRDKDNERIEVTDSGDLEDLDTEPFEIILDHGLIQVNEERTEFLIYESYEDVDDENVYETLTYQEEEVPHPVEDSEEGYEDYELGLSVIDVEVEDAKIEGVEGVWHDGEDISGHIVGIEEPAHDVRRINLDTDRIATFDEEVIVDLDIYNPQKDDAYQKEITVYGSPDDDRDTGFEIGRMVDSYPAEAIMDSKVFIREFNEPSIYKYEFMILDENEDIIAETDYEFKVYEAGEPPSVFDELDEWFNQELFQRMSSVFGLFSSG